MADNESSHLMWVVIVLAVASILFIGLKVAFPNLIGDATNRMAQGAKGLNAAVPESEPDVDENLPIWIDKSNYGANGRFVMDKSGNAKVFAIDKSKPIILNAVPEQTSNHDDIVTLSYLDKVTVIGDASYMFYRDLNLTEIKGLDKFDTSKVTDMRHMFKELTSLVSLDLSSFDTSSATNMSYMLNGLSSLTSLNVAGFDTRNVTTMNNMFCNTSALTSLDISKWDTGNVSDMMSMFSGMTALKSIDLSKWNTSNTFVMWNMFQDTQSLKTLDISKWNTNNVQSMLGMFDNSAVNPLPSWYK